MYRLACVRRVFCIATFFFVFSALPALSASPPGEPASGQTLVRPASGSTPDPAATPRVAFSGPEAPGGYGMVLLKMVLVLGAVCALAYVVLRFGLKRFVAPASANPAMEVVARLQIEPRRAVLVLRIGEQHLVIGSSENGMSRLGELSAEDARALATSSARPASGFRATFARVTGREDLRADPESTTAKV